MKIWSKYFWLDFRVKLVLPDEKQNLWLAPQDDNDNDNAENDNADNDNADKDNADKDNADKDNAYNENADKDNDNADKENDDADNENDNDNDNALRHLDPLHSMLLEEHVQPHLARWRDKEHLDTKFSCVLVPWLT